MILDKNEAFRIFREVGNAENLEIRAGDYRAYYSTVLSDTLVVMDGDEDNVDTRISLGNIESASIEGNDIKLFPYQEKDRPFTVNIVKITELDPRKFLKND